MGIILHTSLLQWNTPGVRTAIGKWKGCSDISLKLKESNPGMAKPFFTPKWDHTPKETQPHPQLGLLAFQCGSFAAAVILESDKTLGTRLKEGNLGMTQAFFDP